MLSLVSEHLRTLVQSFSVADQILLGEAGYSFDPLRFVSLTSSSTVKRIAFIDGGQADIFSAANFTVSFIRVCAQVFAGLEKKETLRSEFFLISSVQRQDGRMVYQGKILANGEKLVSEDNLLVDAHDPLLRRGKEWAGPAIVSSMARRFAELELARKIAADFIVLDGTLEAMYPGEDKLLAALGRNVCALAKSSSLLTVQGNSPVLLLLKQGPDGPWVYLVNELTSFVKLHPRSRHVFRFEGNRDALPFLLPQATDALFLGYPYGLVFVDSLARVSNQEQKAFFLRLLLNSENKEIRDYLSTQDAHAILDSLG